MASAAGDYHSVANDHYRHLRWRWRWRRPAEPWYVGLGDSYQSGEGAEGSDPQNYHPADGVVYEPPTAAIRAAIAPGCVYTFAQKALGVTTGFWACSGARIADVERWPGRTW